MGCAARPYRAVAAGQARASSCPGSVQRMEPKAGDALLGLPCTLCAGALADGPFVSLPPGCLRACLGSGLGRWVRACGRHCPLTRRRGSVMRPGRGPQGVQKAFEKALGRERGRKGTCGAGAGSAVSPQALGPPPRGWCSRGVGVSVLSHGKPQGSWPGGCFLRMYGDVSSCVQPAAL